LTFKASLFNVPPRWSPPLDPAFRPLSLGVRRFRQALAEQGGGQRLLLALEQGPEQCARLDLELFPAGAGHDEDNLRYVAWQLNFLLWSRGGNRVVVSGPEAICAALAAAYAPGGARAFDADLMAKAFGQPFRVEAAAPEQVPEARQRPLVLGGHLEGCRIGFDLGASDYKVAAVRDGQVVFSAELPWNPKVEADPAYHYEHLNAGLRLAASHLPRVDAIGGSSAGILVDNQVRVASLFRAVPPEAFERQAKPLFQRLQAEWQVPVAVINDGEVTALAGALSLGLRGILGVALGSSQAVGYLDPAGHLTGWLNELAFAPVDANPEAGTDDWSGNPGIGAAYFSQQAVDRLAGPAGYVFPASLGLPERLKIIQEGMERGEAGAKAIFESIGIYLGYALPWYAEFYDLEHVLLLGRVTSGAGGERILAKAQEVLEAEFPGCLDPLSVTLPDEQSRRVGQAVAAASLPEV
jgi:predicted NBD/HSP70 family sugar kinase